MSNAGALAQTILYNIYYVCTSYEQLQSILDPIVFQRSGPAVNASQIKSHFLRLGLRCQLFSLMNGDSVNGEILHLLTASASQAAISTASHAIPKWYPRRNIMVVDCHAAGYEMILCGVLFASIYSNDNNTY